MTLSTSKLSEEVPFPILIWALITLVPLIPTRSAFVPQAVSPALPRRGHAAFGERSAPAAGGTVRMRNECKNVLSPREHGEVPVPEGVGREAAAGKGPCAGEATGRWEGKRQPAPELPSAGLARAPRAGRQHGLGLQRRRHSPSPTLTVAAEAVARRHAAGSCRFGSGDAGQRRG